MSRLARAAIRLWGSVLPREFRETLVGDVSEGFRRRRSRGWRIAVGWLVGELVRTPYLALWRQARAVARGGAGGAGGPGWGRGAGTTLRVAARVLLRRPGFTGVAVGTLALSVGAATVVFGLFEAVLLRPLPYPDADRLYAVHGTNEAWRDGEQEFLRLAWDRAGVSIQMIRAWNDLGTLRVAGYQQGSERLRAGDGAAESVAGAWIGPRFFETLEAEPLLGRVPTGEEHATAEPVIVLHQRLWERLFGRDPEILGRTVELHGTARTVVGVMPRTFAVPAEGTLWWAPFPREFTELPEGAFLKGVARLSPGTTPSAATESMDGAVRALASTEPSYEAVGARLVPLREEVLGPVRGGLTLLFAAVCVVVLIACVNLANLVVARGARRMPELALRAALGAGRAGLVGTMLAEVGLVCLAGAVAGVALAAAALGPFLALLTGTMPDFPRAAEVSLNGAVLAFALATTALTAVLAGLPPALAAARRAPAEILQGAERGGRSAGVRRVQSTLLVVEAALAMVLLAGAGLLTRSMARTFALDPGFDSRGVAFMSIRIPEDRFPEEVAALRQLDVLERRLAGVPQVTRVVETGSLPSLGARFTPVRRSGAPPEAAGLVVTAGVGPGYFGALSIPVLEGRTFQTADGRDAPPVAILGASLARRLFGDEDPVGRFVVHASGAVMMGGRAEAAGDEESVEVVGVVGDVRQMALVREADPVLYRPFRQTGGRHSFLVLATDGDASRVLEAARGVAAAVDGVVIEDLGDFREQTFHILAPVHLRTVLLGVLSGLAAVLAMVGIYGVVSYVVSDGRREIGIRIALGARAGAERTRVVRHALVPSLGGASLGVAAALALSRFLESSIFEISRLDPLSYAGTFGLLLAVVGFAAWWPARGATRVDPVDVLRGE